LQLTYLDLSPIQLRLNLAGEAIQSASDPLRRTTSPKTKKNAP
jgi:hypothetical protein